MFLRDSTSLATGSRRGHVNQFGQMLIPIFLATEIDAEDGHMTQAN